MRGSFEEFCGYADVLWLSTACSSRVNEDWLATGDVACFLGCSFSSIIENGLHKGKKMQSFSLDFIVKMQQVSIWLTGQQPLSFALSTYIILSQLRKYCTAA